MYWDPVKEEAENRRKRINSLQSGDSREHLRAEIRRRWKTEKGPVNQNARVIRLVFYILVAILGAYLIFFTNLINHMVSLFLQ
jgi:hypothetical protein